MTDFDILVKRAQQQKNGIIDQMILFANNRKKQDKNKISIKLINSHVKVEKLSLGGK